MRRKTHAEFIQQISRRPFCALGGYRGALMPMRFRCDTCQHEWDTAPNNILHGTGCPKCAHVGHRQHNAIISDNGSWVLVDISTPTYPSATMMIDSADWENIRHQGRVALDSGRYPAVCRVTHTERWVHRIIMGTTNGMDTDHINHNTCDNRRANLRVCTHAENMRNRK